MIKKLVLLLLILCYSSSKIIAQEKTLSSTTEVSKFKLGFHIGLNRSTIIAKNKDTLFSEDYFWKSGLLVGPILYYQFHPLFELKAGINFSILGFRDVDTLFNGSIDRLLIKTNSNFYYLSIPFGIKGTFIKNFNGSFYYEAGGYASYLIQGYTKTRVEKNKSSSARINIDEYTYKIGNNQDDDLTPLDFGVRLGIGLNFNVIDVGLSYNWGLQNISSYTKNETTAFNRFFQFYLIYKIPIKKTIEN